MTTLDVPFKWFRWTALQVARLWRRHWLEPLLSPESIHSIQPFPPSRYLALPLSSIMKIARSVLKQNILKHLKPILAGQLIRNPLSAYSYKGREQVNHSIQFTQILFCSNTEDFLLLKFINICSTSGTKFCKACEVNLLDEDIWNFGWQGLWMAKCWSCTCWCWSLFCLSRKTMHSRCRR